MPDERPAPKPDRCQDQATCKVVMAIGHAVNSAFAALSWDHWDVLRKQMDESKDNPLFQTLMGYVEVTKTLGGTELHTIKSQELVTAYGTPNENGDWDTGYALVTLQYEGELPLSPPFDVVAAACRKSQGIKLGTLTKSHWFCMHDNPDFWPDEVF